MKPVFILAALMVILAPGFAQAQHQMTRARPRRIIDMHFHIWETVRDPAAAAEGAKVSQERGTALEEFQKVLNRNNVEMVLVSGPVDLVQAIVQSAPKRFIGGPAFTESIRLPSIPTLRDEYRAGRLGLFGEIDAQYAGVDPSESWLNPYWEGASVVRQPSLRPAIRGSAAAYRASAVIG